MQSVYQALHAVIHIAHYQRVAKNQLLPAAASVLPLRQRQTQRNLVRYANMPRFAQLQCIEKLYHYLHLIYKSVNKCFLLSEIFHSLANGFQINTGVNNRYICRYIGVIVIKQRGHEVLTAKVNMQMCGYACTIA